MLAKGDQCEPNTLRLTGGSDSEGRVEVCIDGVWGLVSFFGWNTVDAQVVCRQLGYHDVGKQYDCAVVMSLRTWGVRFTILL